MSSFACAQNGPKFRTFASKYCNCLVEQKSTGSTGRGRGRPRKEENKVESAGEDEEEEEEEEEEGED
jgi:hypothetical protein